MPLTQLTTPKESQIGLAQPAQKKPPNKRHPSVSDTQTAKLPDQKKNKQNKPPLLQTNIDVRKMQAQVLEESRQTLGGFITTKPQKVQFVKKIKRQNSLSRTASHQGPHRSDLLKEIYIDSSRHSPDIEHERDKHAKQLHQNQSRSRGPTSSRSSFFPQNLL